jgi:hypothetical protein
MKYNGNRLIPQPFLQLSKIYNLSQDGTVVGSTFNIVIDGKFSVDRGSPSSSGTFWNTTGYPAAENINSTDNWLGIMVKKQEAIRSLFADQGKSFLVEGYEGTNYLQCNPRIKEVQFPEGPKTSWANLSDYRVVMEADQLYLNGHTYTEEPSGLPGLYKIESASEEWKTEIDNPDTGLFRLTHQVSAKGKSFYSTSGTLDMAAWQNAQNWVLTKLGIDYDKLYASGVLNNIGVSGYNYIRGQQLNKFTGEFSVNETWLCFNPSGNGIPAVDEFDVDVQTDEAGHVKVAVKGKIQGLEERDTTTRNLIKRKYVNANACFNSIEPFFLSRASGYANAELNRAPLNKTIGRNPITGVITYNYDYDNRPYPSIPNAITQNIQLSHDLPVDAFAEIFVLGRIAGPVIQNLSAQTATRRNLAIEITVSGTTRSWTAIEPDVGSIISGYVPSATNVFVSQNRKNWDQTGGKFSHNVQWIYSN